MASTAWMRRRDATRAGWPRWSAVGTAAVAAALLALPVAAQSVRWFRATPDYIELARVATAPATGFAVGLASTPQGERRTLVRDGVTVGTEEVTFGSGASGVPERTVRRDADGSLLFDERYRYRADGTLRSLERCDGDGACITVRYAAPSEPTREIVSSDTLLLQFRYDADARPVEIIRRPVDGPEERELRRYDAEGSLIAVETSVGDRLEVTRYRNGRELERTVTVGGRLVERETYRYDAEGLLVERTRSEGRRTERELFVREGGAVVRRERYVDGTLRAVEVWGDDETRVVTRYTEGEPFVRETFVSEALTLRETISDGEVVYVQRFAQSAGSR